MPVRTYAAFRTDDDLVVLRFVITVTCGLGSGHKTIGFCVELGKQVVKITAREGPAERPCGFLVALLEPDQTAFDSCKRGEVVGIEKLELDD